jgi:hypothetical protein
MARTRSSGNAVATYAVQQSEATVEDVGTAELVNGYAAVPIAADFRDTIDLSQRYEVFVTPAGDNRGLYVASRTPAGFVVREAQGGRSTLSFDYRIVARPYGKHLSRLPQVDTRALFAKNAQAMMTRRAAAAYDGTTPDRAAHMIAKFIASQATLAARGAATDRPRSTVNEPLSLP